MYHDNPNISKAIELCLSDSETVILADGFEPAFLGIARQFGKPFAVYDREQCISTLIDGDMTPEEAEEYFSVNVEGAWMGENTPAFVVVV